MFGLWRSCCFVPRTVSVEGRRLDRRRGDDGRMLLVPESLLRLSFARLVARVLACSNATATWCSSLMSVRNLIVDTAGRARSEEHTSELQSLMRLSYAVFCLKKKNLSTPVTNAQLLFRLLIYKQQQHITSYLN